MSINLVTKIGFENDKEYLPQFDFFNSKEKQRVLFLKFFNSKVDKEFRFSKDEIYKYKKLSLKNVFMEKIEALLNVNFSPDKSLCEFNLDKKTSKTINGYKNNINSNNSLLVSPKTRKANNMDSIKVAFNLINMCSSGGKFTLKFDAHDLFSEFVYNKIQKVNKERFTSKCDNCIDIISSHDTTTKVYTYWELLNKTKPDIDKAVSKAVDTIKTTEFNQIYLVYPKHEMFDKHIQIRSNELDACCKEYDIKVIPYSLRSMLR